MICAVLLSTAAWAAPKANPKPPKPAPISEIKVGWDDGGRGGVHGGAGESWTLRPNGTATHTVGVTPMETLEEGNIQTPETSGAFDKNDFARLAAHLQQSRVFALKVPPGDDMTGFTFITLARAGKSQTLTIPDDTLSKAATNAAWEALTLVRGITAQTDWKDPAGHSINTGLDGTFSQSLKDPATGQETYIPTPHYALRNASGKQVGAVEQTSSSAYFRVVLPPGAYTLSLAAPGDAPPPPGYEWRAPSTVQVQAGRFTPIVISLEKTPPTP